MASVSRTLSRIKEDLQPFMPEESILAACQRAGHRWRQRKLGPVQTLHLFILQLLNLNTAMTHLRHLGKTAVAASAYCKARMRLPLKVLEALLEQSSTAMRNSCSEAQALWCGLRAYLVDGSSTIAPDTPDSQKVFGQPKGCKKGCGFPVPKLLGLFDAFSGLMIKVLTFPLYTHEQSKVWMLHPSLGVGDLLVGDRGFCSFAHLAMLCSRGVHGLFRIHQKTIVSFRPHRKHRSRYVKGKKVRGNPMPRSRFIKRLGKHDQVVEWLKSAITRPKWMTDEQYELLPDSLQVRELRFVIPRKGQRTRVVTIATTLLDPLLYPKEKIAELYDVRWRVETHFAQLKTTLRMRKVKSKTSQGVHKELTVYALVYNLIHLVMVRAAAAQGVTPHRISFIDTLRWLLCADPGEELPDLIINPHRPDRHEPRVLKDQQDTYTKMTRPREQLRKELKNQSAAA
ncbi:MAG TPA: IS4 family transposase [Tepidisphaeraceae bacterium]